MTLQRSRRRWSSCLEKREEEEKSWPNDRATWRSESTRKR